MNINERKTGSLVSKLTSRCRCSTFGIEDIDRVFCTWACAPLRITGTDIFVI